MAFLMCLLGMRCLFSEGAAGQKPVGKGSTQWGMKVPPLFDKQVPPKPALVEFRLPSKFPNGLQQGVKTAWSRAPQACRKFVFGYFAVSIA
jgi:hypothetical protein